MKMELTDLFVKFVTAAMLAAAADALMPEGGIKSSANRLIAFAVTASVLVPLLRLLVGG